MKKSLFLKTSLITGALLLCSTIAFAAGPPYKNTAGHTLTVGTSGSDPAVINFNPSPGVIMQVYSSNNAYAIEALNSDINPTDGCNTYLVRSDKTGYYQKEYDTTATGTPTLTDLTKVDADVSGYQYIGSGS